MEDRRRDSEAVADEEQFAIQGSLRIFDQALTPEICSLLIDTFKLNLDKQQTKETFIEINYSDDVEDQDEVKEQLVNFCSTLHEHYMEHLNLPSGIFHRAGVEKLRIRKITNPKDVVVTVDTRDRTSSIRAIGFIFFLNTADSKVQFFRQNVGVQAEEGRVVVYPPNWEYPYRYDLSDEDNDVFALQTYIHYGDAAQVTEKQEKIPGKNA
jgi:hypothetical protein